MKGFIVIIASTLLLALACGETWPWSDWGTCDRDTGIQVRTQRRTCRVDGGWSNWIPFTACLANDCQQTGNRREMRRCDNPRPKNGGRLCQGARLRAVTCHDVTPCTEPTTTQSTTARTTTTERVTYAVPDGQTLGKVIDWDAVTDHTVPYISAGTTGDDVIWGDE